MCPGSQDPRDLAGYVEKTQKTSTPPTKLRCSWAEDYARATAIIDDHLRIHAIMSASASASSAPAPNATPKTVEDLLAGDVLVFFQGQVMILKAEFDDLVEKADKLKLGRKAYGARWPDFKPKANTLNKQFFLKEGDYTEKKLAKMMEGFVKAGGKEEHVVHVKHAFEEMLQSNQNVQMQIDALADVCVQYSQLG